MKSEDLIHLFTERNGQRELVQIDMENIDKDEYFKNLKKKQRKNFIISLKRNANEKN